MQRGIIMLDAKSSAYLQFIPSAISQRMTINADIETIIIIVTLQKSTTIYPFRDYKSFTKHQSTHPSIVLNICLNWKTHSMEHRILSIYL